MFVTFYKIISSVFITVYRKYRKRLWGYWNLKLIFKIWPWIIGYLLYNIALFFYRWLPPNLILVWAYHASTTALATPYQVPRKVNSRSPACATKGSWVQNVKSTYALTKNAPPIPCASKGIVNVIQALQVSKFLY